MAERDLVLMQEASGKFVWRTVTPTAAKHVIVTDASGLPTVIAAVAAPSDGATDADTAVPSVSNPPTQSEVNAIVTAYNALATKYNAMATQFNSLVDKLQSLNILT